MVKAALTEEDKNALKIIAIELCEIRRVLDGIAETLVNLSDKELLRTLNASPSVVKENQVDNYKMSLEKDLDAAKRELEP